MINEYTSRIGKLSSEFAPKKKETQNDVFQKASCSNQSNEKINR